MEVSHNLSFCKTCNRRDAIIQHGRCIVCGYPPNERHESTDPPKPRVEVRSDWPFLDRYVAVLCVVVTLYVMAQVVRWII